MEPKDSSSSNSIPSYMRRAKFLAKNSPRSSLDVQGKKAYLKRDTRFLVQTADMVRLTSSGPYLRASKPQKELIEEVNFQGEVVYTTLLSMVCVKYSAYVRRIVADFLHVLQN
ncbi:hypothetical protein Tco_0699269 [Tanacetum coccineum]